MIVPVHLDQQPGGKCRATCTRCGHAVTAGAPSDTKTEARASALRDLQASCPKGEANRYEDRVIPAGLSLWFVHRGRLFPLRMAGRTVRPLCGPLAATAEVLVAPDAPADECYAAGFASLLRAWDYRVARSVGRAELERLKTAEGAS